jgi:hypothetical protein
MALGRKALERLEQARERLGRNAFALVGDGSFRSPSDTA